VDVDLLFKSLDANKKGYLRFDDFSELLREANFKRDIFQVSPRKGHSLSPNLKSITTTPRFGDHDAMELNLKHERGVVTRTRLGLTKHPSQCLPSEKDPQFNYGKMSKPSENISDLI
jgi:hypothetical protein